MATILCVDADPHLSDLVHYALAREGFDALLAYRGQQALRLVRTARPDLVLLDVALPDLSGLEVLTTLRTVSWLPVVLLSARAAEEEVLAGFARGADDYVAKPFSMQVLLQRVKAILHRATPPPTPAPADSGAYRVQGAHFCANNHEIVQAGVHVALTRAESRILRLLCQHPGQTFAPARIRDCLWGWDNPCDVNVVKTHIRHIRAKFGRLPERPDPIQTLHGVGYRLAQTAGTPSEAGALPLAIAA
jgi:two-component system OmpR family response regulator